MIRSTGAGGPRPFARSAPMLAATVLALAAALMPATAAQAAPARDNSNTERVYFIHGYDIDGTTPSFNCSTYWSGALSVMRTIGGGWAGGLHTVAFYTGDTNCSVRSSYADRNTPIESLGRDLAWMIYNRDTRYGRSVDVVGHSMGGLIIRAALTGVEARNVNYPPALYVEDVVTLATPHHGTPWYAGICQTTQCRDMYPPTSSLLPWLHQGPQSTQGTDWTLTGSYGDGIVDEGSAVAWDGTGIDYNIGHRHKYPQGINHSTIITTTGGVYTVESWHHYARTWKTTTAGWAALVGMRWGLYYWSRE
jgi:PGAP1-like protein